MTPNNIVPVHQEITFSENEIIVSKTDLKGKLTYANDIFCRVAEMSTREFIGKPHSIIRHPDMPRTIFHLLWNTIQAKKEIFAHVKNMSKTGKYYWVIAHVTPSLDAFGNLTGYHSNRRKPTTAALSIIKPLYHDLLEIEKMAGRNDALIAGEEHLSKILKDANMSFDEFIWSLEN